MKDPHYRVFISSTYLDNVSRRQVVLEAIERAGRMVAVRMERFTADDRPTVEVCLSRSADCELFVGIVAHRYGWEPEGQPAGEEKSITWLEYEAAKAAGRPRLMSIWKTALLQGTRVGDRPRWTQCGGLPPDNPRRFMAQAPKGHPRGGPLRAPSVQRWRRPRLPPCSKSAPVARATPAP